MKLFLTPLCWTTIHHFSIEIQQRSSLKQVPEFPVARDLAVYGANDIRQEELFPPKSVPAVTPVSWRTAYKHHEPFHDRSLQNNLLVGAVGNEPIPVAKSPAYSLADQSWLQKLQSSILDPRVIEWWCRSCSANLSRHFRSIAINCSGVRIVISW